MAITQVVRGIGRGSIFGNGRYFGFHNPFSSDISKARDPFINVSTLKRISQGADSELRDSVRDNLVAKLKGGMDDDILLKFPKDICFDVAKQPQTPVLAIASIIIHSFSAGRNVVTDKEPVTISAMARHTSSEDIANAGGDPASTYSVDTSEEQVVTPGEWHYEFSKNSLEIILDILRAHTDKKASQIRRRLEEAYQYRV